VHFSAPKRTTGEVRCPQRFQRRVPRDSRRARTGRASERRGLRAPIAVVLLPVRVRHGSPAVVPIVEGYGGAPSGARVALGACGDGAARPRPRRPQPGDEEGRAGDPLTLYSKAEALAALGKDPGGDAFRFQSLVERAHPGVRFEWKAISRAIAENLEVLPETYDCRSTRLQAGFRRDLLAFARQIVLTDRLGSTSARQVLEEHPAVARVRSRSHRPQASRAGAGREQVDRGQPLLLEVRVRPLGRPGRHRAARGRPVRAAGVPPRGRGLPRPRPSTC
jgi:hypothetical protein